MKKDGAMELQNVFLEGIKAELGGYADDQSMRALLSSSAV